jgi:hypothetical protein
MTKLRETSETTIALIFLVMNLDKILRDLLSALLKWLLSKSPYRIETTFLIAV